jgi:hypothetical protein
MSFLIDPYRFSLPPLLDVYPGADAAYSVRLLRTAYTGSAIRVRRSSDNNEQDIGFIGNNLNVASLLAFCGVSNGFVTTWYDQSGNNRNAANSTATAQPQIVSNGSILLLNAIPVINFDGSNDLLGISNFIQDDNNIAIFSVQKVNNSGSGISMMILDGSNAIYLPWNVGNQKWFYGNGDIFNQTTNQTNRRLFALFSNTTNATLNIDSVFKGSRSNQAYTYTGLHSIGSLLFGFYNNCSYQEIVIYKTNQTSNVSGIEININNYFKVYP